MQINIGNALISIFRTWPTFKNVIDGTEKLLQLQYEQDSSKYFIFALDNSILYYTDIFKAGFEPSGWSAGEITDNASYRTDFETNFEPNSNRQVQVVTVESATRTKRIDMGTTYDYIGYAELGALASDPVWTIKRITKNVDGDPESIEWTTEASAVWDDRATETYS